MLVSLSGVMSKVKSWSEQVPASRPVVLKLFFTKEPFNIIGIVRRGDFDQRGNFDQA